MQQSLYSAAVGMTSQQTRLDTIAQNIANSQSAGYKAARVDFKDALYQTMKTPVLEDGAENNLLVGSGAVVASIATTFEQGSIVATGEMYDFAIAGSGFFALRGRNGEVMYTRSGSFRAAPFNDEMYLTSQSGEFVLGTDGDVIRIPDGGIRVAEDGTIYSNDERVGQIGLYDFTNPNGLSKVGETRFMETAASGPAEAQTEGIILQGNLEQSNVSLADEMTMLIRSQRAYALMSRALSTTDNMLGLANTMHS